MAAASPLTQNQFGRVCARPRLSGRASAVRSLNVAGRGRGGPRLAAGGVELGDCWFGYRATTGGLAACAGQSWPPVRAWALHHQEGGLVPVGAGERVWAEGLCYLGKGQGRAGVEQSRGVNFRVSCCVRLVRASTKCGRKGGRKKTGAALLIRMERWPCEAYW